MYSDAIRYVGVDDIDLDLFDTDMTVSRWKTNKIQPSMAQFVEIARLLQVDIKDLLEVDLETQNKKL